MPNFSFNLLTGAQFGRVGPVHTTGTQAPVGTYATAADFLVDSVQAKNNTTWTVRLWGGPGGGGVNVYSSAAGGAYIPAVGALGGFVEVQINPSTLGPDSVVRLAGVGNQPPTMNTKSANGGLAADAGSSVGPGIATALMVAQKPANLNATYTTLAVAGGGGGPAYADAGETPAAGGTPNTYALSYSVGAANILIQGGLPISMAAATVSQVAFPTTPGQAYGPDNLGKLPNYKRIPGGSGQGIGGGGGPTPTAGSPVATLGAAAAGQDGGAATASAGGAAGANSGTVVTGGSSTAAAAGAAFPAGAVGAHTYGVNPPAANTTSYYVYGGMGGMGGFSGGGGGVALKGATSTAQLVFPYLSPATLTGAAWSGAPAGGGGGANKFYGGLGSVLTQNLGEVPMRTSGEFGNFQPASPVQTAWTQSFWSTDRLSYGIPNYQQVSNPVPSTGGVKQGLNSMNLGGVAAVQGFMANICVPVLPDPTPDATQVIQIGIKVPPIGGTTPAPSSQAPATTTTTYSDTTAAAQITCVCLGWGATQISTETPFTWAGVTTPVGGDPPVMQYAGLTNTLQGVTRVFPEISFDWRWSPKGANTWTQNHVTFGQTAPTYQINPETFEVESEPAGTQIHFTDPQNGVLTFDVPAGTFTNGQVYDVQMRIVDPDGASPWVALEELAPQPKPPAPTWTSPTNGGNILSEDMPATISWTIPPGQTVQWVEYVLSGKNENDTPILFDSGAINVTRENLITNPSFEGGISGWSALTTTSFPTTPTIASDTTAPQFGTSDLKITWGAGTNVSTSAVSTIVDTVPGTTYVFSAAISTDAATPTNNVILAVRNNDGTDPVPLQQVSVTPGAAPAATYGSVVFTAQDTSTELLLVSGGANTGNNYVDAAVCEINGTATVAPGAATYFDGSTANSQPGTASWEGTANASKSLLTVANLTSTTLDITDPDSGSEIQFFAGSLTLTYGPHESNGEASLPATVNFSINTPPTTPTATLTEDDDAGTITLDIESADGTVVRAEVYRTNLTLDLAEVDLGSANVQTNPDGSTSLTFIDYTPASNTLYQYRVRAYGASAGYVDLV